MKKLNEMNAEELWESSRKSKILDKVSYSKTVMYLNIRANDIINGVDIDVKTKSGKSHVISIYDEKFTNDNGRYMRIINIDNPDKAKDALSHIVHFFRFAYLDHTIYSQFNSKCPVFIIKTDAFKVSQDSSDRDKWTDMYDSTDSISIKVFYNNVEEERLRKNELAGKKAINTILNTWFKGNYPREDYRIYHIGIEAKFDSVYGILPDIDFDLNFDKYIEKYIGDIYPSIYVDGDKECKSSLKAKDYANDFKTVGFSYFDDNSGISPDTLVNSMNVIGDFLKFSDNTNDETIDSIINLLKKASFINVWFTFEDLRPIKNSKY